MPTWSSASRSPSTSEESARAFVRALAAAARKHVCLTAAGPGQAGLCHVNCQPKSFWIRLFADQGFAFDEVLTDRWQRENAEAGLAPGCVTI